MKPTLSSLVARLRSPEPAEETWAAYAELAPADREAVVRALKAELDHLVRNRPSEAVPLARVLVRCATGNEELEALALRGLGTAQHFSGDGKGAVQSFRRACELYESSGCELEAATVRRSLVDIHQTLGQVSEALEVGHAARGVLQRLGAERVLAQLEVNVGNVYMMRLDDYGRAREHYRTAREIFARIEDPVGLAFADLNLGVVEMNANRLTDSRSFFETAERGFEVAGMTLHVADARYHLAYLESRRGRFAKAIEGLRRVRERYRELEKPGGVPMCDLDLAEIFLRLDARLDSAEHAASARDGYAELGMEYELAKSEALWGQATLSLGQPEGAAAIRRAIDGFRDIGNEPMAGFLELQDLERGGDGGELVHRLRGLRGSLRARDCALLADLASLSLARALAGSDDASERREARSLLTALTSEPTRDPIDALVEAEAWQVLAHLHRREGERDEAREALEHAVARIDRSYLQVPGADRRLAFFRRPHNAFVELAWMRTAEGRPEAAREALRVIERGRMRSLRETRAHSGSENAEERDARERLEWLVSRRLDADLGSITGPADLRSAGPSTDELHDAQREFLRLRRIRRSEAGSGPDPDGEVVTSVADGEVALVYLAAREGLAALVVDGDKTRVARLPLDRAAADDLRDRFGFHAQRFELGGTYLEPRRRDVDRSLRHLLEELGERLLAPVYEHLVGRHVVVVTADPLHGLPFHAMRVGGRVLLADCTVSYALSLTHLAALRARSDDGRAERGPIHVCAEARPELPGAGAEAELLAELYGPRLVRASATDLTRGLREGRFASAALHLAGHGVFDTRHPELSALHAGSAVLFAEDLRLASVSIPLVTLSGCDTAVFGHRSGEELVGLPRAFLGAGCRATVGSLWALADADARRLMERFYRLLAGGEPVGRALNLVQRELASADQPLETWAPFCLFGDPSVRLPSFS
ncbi:MAG: CHAT domain-containing tetratricopeptide repeat protein [Planctomycetota bacterium]